MNSCHFSGNLTRDPELRQTPGGVDVCDFTVAVNNRKKVAEGHWEDDPCYIDCVAWDSAARLIAQWYKKGSHMYVHGEMRQERWEAEDGSKRSRMKLVLRSRDFGPPPPREARGQGAQNGVRNERPVRAPAAVSADDEGLPF